MRCRVWLGWLDHDEGHKLRNVCRPVYLFAYYTYISGHDLSSLFFCSMHLGRGFSCTRNRCSASIRLVCNNFVKTAGGSVIHLVVCRATERDGAGLKIGASAVGNEHISNVPINLPIIRLDLYNLRKHFSNCGLIAHQLPYQKRFRIFLPLGDQLSLSSMEVFFQVR